MAISTSFVQSADVSASAEETAHSDDDGYDVGKRHVLIAEDSPVTQDLLKLILQQRGHDVDIVADGEEALAALAVKTYDAALMDFHLPKLNGLEVANRFRRLYPDKARTRLLAITSDIKGLLTDDANCENFDAVIPKPFDLEDLVSAVEREAIEAESVSRVGRVSPDPDPIDKVGISLRDDDVGYIATRHELLRWPEDFSSDRLSARAMQASLADDRFDGIVINEPTTVRSLSIIWTTKALHLLPIIDMTGSVSGSADVDASKRDTDETDRIDRVIQAFRERRAMLHRHFCQTDDIGEKLIGRMFVSGGSLKAHYHEKARELVGYNTMLDFRSIDKEIGTLLSNGLIRRIFFDRFHYCEKCGSSHLNVREECPACHTSNLTEEPYLHHFKCAYQGPESDFRQEDDLICPKCRKALSHFSIDYDKPGSVISCNNCNHASSEPDVGFLCIECGKHSDGDKIPTRDIYSYALTGKGTEFAKIGRTLLDGNQGALRFAELPLELIVAINAELKNFDAEGRPFALMSISFGNARQIERSEGTRLFMKTRDQFRENLRHAIRKNDHVVNGNNYDFVLLKGVSPDEARTGFADLIDEATAALRLDLGVHIDVCGPDDIR